MKYSATNWKAVVSIPSKKEIIEKIIKEIYFFDYLEVTKENNSEITEIGVLAGDMSRVIFNYYYAQLFGIENNTLAQIESIINTLSNSKITDYLVNGIAGLGWGISFLSQESLIIKNNSRDVLIEIDNYIKRQIDLLLEMENGNLDFFYGLIGYGIYLLERENEGVDKSIYLKKIVDNLFSRKVEKEAGFYWITDYEDSECIELSISHGQSMILYFLSNVMLKYPKLVEKKTLKSVANFIVASNEKFCFPDVIEGGKKVFSPLRWCHGTSSISWVLLKVSIILNDYELKKISFDSLLKCSKRLDEKAEELPYPILCHGTIGMGHFFNRSYQLTKENAFLDVTLSWLEKGIEQFYTKGIAFYAKEKGILLGLEGIGLALISLISNIPPKWDRSLLLS